MKLPKSIKTTSKQRKTYEKQFKENGRDRLLIAEIRHDDTCHNGHNSFAITGEVWRCTPKGSKLGNDILEGGCIHERIVKHFPELEPLIKWHLTTTDGPTGYVNDAIYHANNRDYNDKLKGEPLHFKTAIKFESIPILSTQYSEKFYQWLEPLITTKNNYDLEIIEIDHKEREIYGTKYTFGGFAKRWHGCPFDTEDEALNFLKALQKHDHEFIKIATSWGKGKEPNLEAARNSAIWPDAELSDFTKEKLNARLPKLMREFKKAVESVGLIY